MLLAGTRLGSYEIVAPLGSGGMGEVYRAHDARLKRDVAVKFLPPDLTGDPVAVGRFRREALTIASLNHPHICTIHDIGDAPAGLRKSQPFIVMELIEGSTLKKAVERKALDGAAAIELAIEIADALAAAHAKGIVHRDLKPTNLFVTAHGHAKILDFGLAKHVSGEIAGDATSADDGLTGVGVAVGTISYMSPEQALGQAVDNRSDIFSFGVVLYEMLTGTRPFTGATAAAVFNEILNRSPEPPSRLNADISASLDGIVVKCLAKNPEHRYQNAAEVRADLRKLRLAGTPATVPAQAGVASPPGSGPIDSILVLPFVNGSSTPDSEYLSDGITDGLINSLSKLGKVRVVPRTLAFTYKGTTSDLQIVAKALNVRAVVTGRVALHGDMLIVGAELTDAATVSQAWGDRYARKMADIFDLQDDIVRDIVKNLRVRLAGDDEARLVRKSTHNPEAYQLFMRGRFEFERMSPQGLNAAIGFFEDALRLDSKYVTAHVEVARAYMFLTWAGAMPVAEGFGRARVSTLRALETDDTSGGAHFAMGAIKWMSDWDAAGAEAEFLRALELDPTWESLIYDLFLSAHGRHDEAIAEARRVVGLNPTSMPNLLALARVLCEANRADEALWEALKLREMYPGTSTSHMAVGRVQLAAGRYDKAAAALATAIEMGNRVARLDHTIALARLGRRDDAQQVVAAVIPEVDQGNIPPSVLAAIFVALDQPDAAFAWLDRGLASRDSAMLSLRVDPLLASLRRDPRWNPLARRVIAAGGLKSS
jgi:serine/threonine protein kinase/tetratricopeptide (TPR) repeat protein